MDIFILELVSNQLTVSVKIDGRQQQEETRSILKVPLLLCKKNNSFVIIMTKHCVGAMNISGYKSKFCHFWQWNTIGVC